jgi:hypothetical protein
MGELELTPLEADILGRSADLRVTTRRRAVGVFTGLAFGGALAIATCTRGSGQLVLVVALIHVGLTILERVLYANAVLAYKGLVQKLKAHIEELEGPVPPHDGVAG